VPGDALHAQQGLTWRRRVQTLNRNAARIQAIRDQIVGDLEGKQREVEALSRQIERLTKVGELLRVLMDKLVTDQVRTIEGIVTEGLRAIFFDQQLTFEAEISQKYNKVAIDFFFRQGSETMAVRGHPLESFGGGPSSIASLVLRLLAILRLKRAPVLFLDETLGAINGDEYIDAAGQFLKKLAATTGIHILYVSQKQAFLDHADLAYQGHSVTEETNGSWSLGLRRMRGAR
jgi:DNA repair exonuclease SbcCD ATPase subunit